MFLKFPTSWKISIATKWCLQTTILSVHLLNTENNICKVTLNWTNFDTFPIPVFCSGFLNVITQRVVSTQYKWGHACDHWLTLILLINKLSVALELQKVILQCHVVKVDRDFYLQFFLFHRFYQIVRGSTLIPEISLHHVKAKTQSEVLCIFIR